MMAGTTAQGATPRIALTPANSLRQLGFTASLSALLGGISEPTTYGICYKMVKPWYAYFITAFQSFLRGVLLIVDRVVKADHIHRDEGHNGHIDHQNDSVARLRETIAMKRKMFSSRAKAGWTLSGERYRPDKVTYDLTTGSWPYPCQGQGTEGCWSGSIRRSRSTSDSGSL